MEVPHQRPSVFHYRHGAIANIMARSICAVFNSSLHAGVAIQPVRPRSQLNGRYRWIILLLLLAGCVRPTGSAQVATSERSVPPSTAGIASVDYWRDIQPILERRCAVCHACYDAPCQLNLTAFEGLTRGANKRPVYDGTRLLTAEPTRLFDDAHTVEAWRKKDFFPVVQDQMSVSDSERRAGVLARILALKQANPLPADMSLSDSFDFSLNREQSCPTASQFDRFAEKHPLWGMPFGLPGLTDQEYQTVLRWIELGTPYQEQDRTSARALRQVREWEDFLNGESLKHQLMARYLYEHLHLTHLYFDELPNHEWFRLVRSRTAPGHPIDVIATRRPFDDPGVPRVYYRLEAVKESLTAKTHVPYALSSARKQRYEELFLSGTFTVDALPSYDSNVASNPFVAFRDLPVRSRYRFLLDDARSFVMQFIKGPVCRGEVALNVIDDRFWIFFIDPDSAVLDKNEQFLAEMSQHLYLPTSEGAARLGLISWLKYSTMQNEFLKAKQAYIERLNVQSEAPDLAFIWDGRGQNRNAALTVFRHQDSGSVVHGLVGEEPKTAWLLSYDLFERIYYLLVAGFDVYSFAGHQLDTRLYMDFLRMEGEFNFLMLLPIKERERLRDFWYRDAHESVKDYVYGRHISVQKESGIVYHSDQPQHELFGLLRERIGTALESKYTLIEEPDVTLREPLRLLMQVKGKAVQWMPEMALLTIASDEGLVASRADQTFTLLHDNGFSNVASLFDQASRRLPDEDRLTVARGVIGAYPNALYHIRRSDLPEFVAAVANLTSEEDYHRLTARFAVRRTNPAFWAHSDAIHEAYRRIDPLNAGLFDYNRLENR